MIVSLSIMFRFFLLQENSREIRVLQTNQRTFRIASSDALSTELSLVSISLYLPYEKNS